MGKIGDLTLGVSIKRCEECEYKNRVIRDELLVIAGARAAYLDMKNHIDIPEGTEGEHDLAYIVTKLVDRYLYNNDDISFDLYIESALAQKYGGSNV